MKRQNRKGFTIVELVIVIAVIAILAAVLIPTFAGLVNKANVASDTALIKNLNTALAADTDGCKTMQEALDAAAEYGFDVAKINAKASKNEILWDSVNNVFCYFDSEKGDIAYIPEYNVKETPADVDYWVVASTPNEKYSTYLYDYEGDGVLTGVKTGLDVGACTVTSIAFDGAEADIFTNGGKLIINNVNAEVNHYGTADEVVIEAVASQSYHVYGKVTTLKVSEGRVVPEAGAEIKVLVVADVAAGKSVEVAVADGAKVETVVVADNTPADVIASIKIAVGEDAVKEVAVDNIENVVTGAAYFAGGMGTEADPYLIETAEHIKNIALNYNTYAYYKVADGVDTIDCSNWNRVNLNGSFNGNGVTLNGLDSVLFNNVGTGAESESVVLENFTVKFEGGAGIARVCATPNLTFKNITANGYLVEDWNGAIFLRYGSNNFVDGGFDYTVNFVNCASAAEIYSTANAYSSILVGHTYPGNGSVTINVDAATNSAVDATTLYYTGAQNSKCGYKYYGAGSATVNVDGVATSENKITGENIVVIDSTKTPVKNNGIWNIDTEADTSKVVIKLNWQYTLYTENYAEKIADQSGVGGLIGDEIVIEVANGEAVDVLAQINSVEIKTGADKWDYELVDGKLTIYMTTDNQYVDGNLALIVEQYTAGSSIAKYTGRVNIATKTTSADWIVK